MKLKLKYLSVGHLKNTKAAHYDQSVKKEPDQMIIFGGVIHHQLLLYLNLSLFTVDIKQPPHLDLAQLHFQPLLSMDSFVASHPLISETRCSCT